MLRRLAASFLDRVATRFENELHPSELRRWARDSCVDVLAQTNSEGNGLCDDARRDIGAIVHSARVVFPDIVFPDIVAPAARVRAADLDGVRAWIERVAATHRFPKDAVPTHLGAALDALAAEGMPTTPALEVLLRHVELRRAECLHEWVGVATEMDRNYERFGVATLFVRTTARDGDWRFLNAALKMIDWFGVRHIRGHRDVSPRLRRVMLQTTLEVLACLNGADAE